MLLFLKYLGFVFILMIIHLPLSSKIFISKEHRMSNNYLDGE